MKENKLKIITKSEFDALVEAQKMHKRCKAFICPMCDTVQSMASLVDAGVPKDEVHNYIGFSCEGRWRDAGSPMDKKRDKTIRGCNWTLGGLFKLHKMEVMVDGEPNHPFFEPATPEQAQELAEIFGALDDHIGDINKMVAEQNRIAATAEI